MILDFNYEQNFKDGEKDGLSKEWHENGQRIELASGLVDEGEMIDN